MNPSRAAHPAIALPPTWKKCSDPGPGVVVAARAPRLPASGIAPEMTLHVTRGVASPLERWRCEVVEQLADLLPRFELEDDDLYDLGGELVAYHRWSSLVGTADVLCEQWSWLIDATGITLTCTVAREDYPVYCEMFEAAAATLELSPVAA